MNYRERNGLKFELSERTYLTKDIFQELEKLVLLEHQNQRNKFGKQTHSFEMWYMILMEEIAEISQEFIKFKFYDIENYDNVKKEMIQSITLLIKMFFAITSIDMS